MNRQRISPSGRAARTSSAGVCHEADNIAALTALYRERLMASRLRRWQRRRRSRRLARVARRLIATGFVCVLCLEAVWGFRSSSGGSCPTVSISDGGRIARTPTPTRPCALSSSTRLVLSSTPCRRPQRQERDSGCACRIPRMARIISSSGLAIHRFHPRADVERWRDW